MAWGYLVGVLVLGKPTIWGVYLGVPNFRRLPCVAKDAQNAACGGCGGASCKGESC